MLKVLNLFERLFGDVENKFDFSTDIADNDSEINLGIFSRPNLPSLEDLFYTDNPIDPSEPQIFGFPYSGKELLERIRQHKSKFRKEIRQKRVIAIVHPLFTFLSGSYEYTGNLYQDMSKKYLENLCILFSKRNRGRYGLVFLSVPAHYGALEGAFLESGLVDDVLFTKPHEGTLLQLEQKETNPLSSAQEVVVAGGYVRGCCGKFLKDILEYKMGQVSFAPELMFPAPNDHNYKTQRDVYKKLSVEYGLKARSMTELTLGR